MQTKTSLSSFSRTVATALSLRLCYALMTAVGSSLVIPQAQSGGMPGQVVPPVPSILHLAHAAIAALLLAMQFTPFFRPQAIAEEAHPIARKCLGPIRRRLALGLDNVVDVVCLALGQFQLGRGVDVVADILNCLTSFPLFWCFLVLDKPNVALPGDPNRNLSFRKAIGTVWESEWES